MRKGVTNEAAVGLPPLNDARKDIWDYYKIEFLSDGYPGKRLSDGRVEAHPIYGPYVIADYVAEYRRTQDQTYLESARRVARAAGARMTTRGDALTFDYDPAKGISNLPLRFYSGLTQARYLDTLGSLLSVAPDPEIAEIARAVLRSLLIPVEDGGVLRKVGGGTVIEEYAHEFPDLTLNGWTTATVLTSRYAQASRDEAAWDLVAQSRRGIAHVLPLYDVPELANSRYRLTGPIELKIVLSHPTKITNARLSLPGTGVFPVDARPHKWTSNLVMNAQGTGAEATLQVCRATFPDPNVLLLDLHTEQECAMDVSIGVGPFDPLTSLLRPTRWEHLRSVDLAAGHGLVEIEVPWDRAELAAYPNNWGKPIGGKNYNAYHFIHIDTLRKLDALQHEPMFRYFANRWASYVDRWPEIPELRGRDLALHQHGKVRSPTDDAGGAAVQDEAAQEPQRRTEGPDPVGGSSDKPASNLRAAATWLRERARR